MKDQAKIHRFYLPHMPAVGGRAALDEGEAHHARHVLRLAAGAAVEVFSGQGAVGTGRIAEVTRAAVVVQVEAVNDCPRKGPRVHLAFAVPKGKRLDWLLEKAAELGAASLRPVIFERSVAGPDELSASAMERWHGHCLAAAKQSGLNFLPAIEQPRELAAFLRALAGGTAGILGDADPAAPPLIQALSRPAQAAAELVLLIGPEGGLTPRERQMAVAAGCSPARLGHTTLRIETAAVALLAATMAILD